MFPKHGKLAILTIFFLSLVLMLLLSGTAVSLNYEEDINYIDIESGETEQRPSGGMQFTANSRIPVGKTWWSWTIKPEGLLRWYLYNPSGDIVLYKDVGEIHEIAPGKGWFADPDIYVPFFPGQGQWRLDLVKKGVFFGIIEFVSLTYHFNVGESSLADNLMAPIPFTWGGFPAVKWGEFSTALPGLFWISSPFWGFAILFLGLVFYKRSFRLAVVLIKESGKRFREGIAKKS